MRPPASYTDRLKVQQIAAYGYANPDPRLYEEDHLVPLELGGNPTDPLNLFSSFLSRRGWLLPSSRVKPNKPSIAQVLWLDQLRCSGVEAYLWFVEDWDDAVEILSQRPPA